LATLWRIVGNDADGVNRQVIPKRKVVQLRYAQRSGSADSRTRKGAEKNCNIFCVPPICRFHDHQGFAEEVLLSD